MIHHNAAYFERGLKQGTNSAKIGTATVSHVLEGKTFTNANSIGLSGSMKNRGSLNWNPTTNTSYSIPAGYYSGGTLNSAGAYNAGMTAADNRVNTNSTNYKTGYNAGVAAADGRLNTNSVSYLQGIQQIKNFTLILNCTGYLLRDKDNYKREISFTITVKCENGAYTCTAPGYVGNLDEDSAKGIEAYITSVTVTSMTFN